MADRHAASPQPALPDAALPEPVADWFADRGWVPHAHQLEMLAAARAGRSALLIAPTGGGKTLAGFLPSLCDLAERPRAGLHTLYISPLKALTQDIQRNLETPVSEIGLDVSIETRTGDTPQGKRKRQRLNPPNMLLTTPESLALMLSYPDAPEFFANLECVVLDELHALAGTKRGDLLALGLARLNRLAPTARRVGLSATVRDPSDLRAWLSPTARDDGTVRQVDGGEGPKPEIDILTTREYLPWSGHMAVHALGEVYERLKQAETTLIFVNTRAQAEIVFQELWRLNEDTLAIALHHGSLEVEQRRRVEAAMARGDLKAVVATSSLDLGIDWAAIDLVVQVGAPKGVARLLQRIGRANHRLDAPSRALLVPANRFEVLECRAAVQAVQERTLDGEPLKAGGLDVLCQHILSMACSAPVDPDDLYAEILTAQPYRELPRADFDDAFAFVDHGGYALKGYRKFRRMTRDDNGFYRVASIPDAQRYRMNVGTIVEAPTLKVKLKGGRVLGEIEEFFAQHLSAGDTFLFSGQLLRFERIKELTCEVTRATKADQPKVPNYVGGRMPLSTHLAERVRGILEDARAWADLPGPVASWLGIQRWRSSVPGREGLLVESFPRGDKEFLVAYCFEGRNAHQTLGMLITKRMERLRLSPLGFVATDYVLAVWSLRAPSDDQVAQLFDQDILGDELEEWMDESSMLRRTFRNVGVVAGLIEKQLPGQEKSGKQVTFSADLVYDVLRKHQPDHILLRATRQDAAGGLTDIRRLSDMLGRVAGRITHTRLERISPLAVPVLLEIGREQVQGEALDDLLDEGAQALIDEATAPEQDQAQLPL